MKKTSPAFLLLIVSSFTLLFSCKKINEATTLGGDLIPAVDNVNTFEISLDAQTSNNIFPDSTKVGYYDAVAAGDLNDPEFGHTHANFDFNVSPTVTGSYPFIATGDSLQIDSVVLSLSYAGSYGDSNALQTLRVFEIAPGADLRSDTVYTYSDPLSDFPTTGAELASVSFYPRDLNDSVDVIRPGDTSRVANVLRIKFSDNSLGQRFAQYDTTNTSNGGFRNDSIFRTLFKGLAVKADNGGNALTYFTLSDNANTRLMVYFRAIKNGDTTFSSVNFAHTTSGQSNYIQREHNANVVSGGSDIVYVQSVPGSCVKISIPALATLSNRVIHRAELVATKIPSSGDNIFTEPTRLFLDRINSTEDSSYLFEKDLSLGSDGSVGFQVFGGSLNSDNTYRFNITRYVQGVVTRHERNDVLRLWAPLRAYEYSASSGSYLQLPVNNKIARGRAVLAGGDYPDPGLRLRLRIIYSNL